MFVDARTVPHSDQLEADICIVGAGPAGIALATSLSGFGRRIIVAESGGLEPDSATQLLNDGETVGLSYRVNESRLRYFGGSGNHWGGGCRPLDSSDFVGRDWVPDSGWPFGRSELEPYYSKARLLCGLAQEDASAEDMRARGSMPVPWLDPLETAIWQTSPARPFGTRFRSTLSEAPGVTVLLNANLVQLVTKEQGRTVAAGRFGTLSGVQFTIIAHYFVLACGGIENARLLLAMPGEYHPAGLGNEHDLVGRFFTEHPEMLVGALVYSRSSPAVVSPGGHWTKNEQFSEGFRLTDRIQQSAQIGNVAFWPLWTTDLTALPELDTGIAPLIQDMFSRIDVDSPSGPRTCTALTVSFEQSPNADSRITLTDARDAFDMRRVRLDWRLNHLDARTFATALKIMARESGRQRIGRFWLRPPLRHLDLDRPDSIQFNIPKSKASPTTFDTELLWGSHHMGTTRMHLDSRRGVVDPQCRVHSLTNLYIAGSSVFPSVGVSNPTFTILALALRLADHLKKTSG